MFRILHPEYKKLFTRFQMIGSRVRLYNISQIDSVAVQLIVVTRIVEYRLPRFIQSKQNFNFS